MEAEKKTGGDWPAVMTDAEFAAYRRRVVRSPSKADPQSRQSEKQSGAESELSKELDPAGETFPFQCSCGVKHQFDYTENAEGRRLLRVKQDSRLPKPPAESDPASHIRFLKEQSFSIQGSEALPTLQSIRADPELARDQSSAILHPELKCGEIRVIRIGTPLEPSAREAFLMCLSALRAVPRSMWVLVKVLVGASALQSKHLLKVRR